MDVGLFVILMIVLYMVPEILKRSKKKQPYQYPEFPSEADAGAGTPGTMSQGTQPPPVPLYAGMTEEAGGEANPSLDPAAIRSLGLAASAAEYAPAVSAATLTQGVVWAEIIAPPVSRRRRNFGMKRF